LQTKKKSSKGQKNTQVNEAGKELHEKTDPRKMWDNGELKNSLTKKQIERLGKNSGLRKQSKKKRGTVGVERNRWAKQTKI